MKKLMRKDSNKSKTEFKIGQKFYAVYSSKLQLWEVIAISDDGQTAVTKCLDLYKEGESTITFFTMKEVIAFEIIPVKFAQESFWTWFKKIWTLEF